MWPFRRKKNFGDAYAEMLEARFAAYRQWASEQMCQGCGTKASDRLPGSVWITEDWIAKWDNCPWRPEVVSV